MITNRDGVPIPISYQSVELIELFQQTVDDFFINHVTVGKMVEAYLTAGAQYDFTPTLRVRVNLCTFPRRDAQRAGEDLNQALAYIYDHLSSTFDPNVVHISWTASDLLRKGWTADGQPRNNGYVKGYGRYYYRFSFTIAH